uniref:SRCR domain-containing protein n=1 Tax=Rhabditophanes sp. KR3021 TaxID=114890 RepID=A0AC35TST9_9BILA
MNHTASILVSATDTITNNDKVIKVKRNRDNKEHTKEYITDYYGSFDYDHTTEKAIPEVDNEKPFYKHIPGTSGLNCSIFFDEKQKSVTRRFGFHRVHYKEQLSERSNDSCTNVRKRHYFPSKLKISDYERDFPLAYSTMVYTDYYAIELQLALSYSPYNEYCYVIDKKAPSYFVEQMNLLGSCFDNVHIANVDFEIDSNGKNYAKSHLECLDILDSKDWKYAFLLQNHDFPLKTNKQLVDILTLFNGSSDFQMVPNYLTRIDHHKNWTYEALNLMQNKSLNTDEDGNLKELNFVKGFSELTISRLDVNYINDYLNLTTMVEQLNYKRHGIDEMVWGTLLSDENLAFPGGMPKFCVERGERVEYLTRKSIWRNRRLCKSGMIRHEICIHGVENLSTIKSYPHLFLNKLMITKDAGAMNCWSEMLWKKRYGFEDQSLDMEFYLKTPHVRWRQCQNNNDCDPDTFKCSI